MKTLLQLGRAGERISGLEIVDMHGHLGAYNFAIPNLDPSSVVAAMDRVGVVKTLVSHMRCMSADAAWGNRQVLAAMQAFPGRLLGYAILWPSSAEDVRRELEFCLSNGFTGIKLHNATGFAYTTPAYEPAYSIAEERRLPVLLHTYGEEPVFEQVAEITAKYPNIPIIMAHAGANNTPGYIRMAREHENVFLDLSLSASRRRLIEQFVAEAGAEKVMWGSDVLFYSQAHQIGRVLGAEITEEEKRKILSGNACRILGDVAGSG